MSSVENIKSTTSKHPWSRSLQAVLEALETSKDRGLTRKETKQRRKEYGENRLRQAEKQSAWKILIEQFRSVVVLLLVAAAVAAFSFGQWLDGIAIVVVIVINTAIGFGTELHAVRSMEALRTLSQVKAKVRRDGQVLKVHAEDLVPGDIVLVEGGDLVTADIRLLEANKLQVNESALTGESVPVGKQVEPLDEGVDLAERSNMLFKGTAVTRGSGEGIVVSTGMETELGQISSLVESAEASDTPLEKQLEQMGRKLVWITLAIAGAVIGLGALQQKRLLLMVETGIALAVAAIPEGLPIVATIALARGMRRMARRNALVNRLSAVETLGGTNVICTDKTGTLTENQMTVTQIALPSGIYEVSGEGLETTGEFTQDEEPQSLEQSSLLCQALQVGVLCNNATLPDSETETLEQGSVGDPMEVALLVVGAKAGLSRSDLLSKRPEQREEAFDSETKMMATFHSHNDRLQVAVKGAPEAILEHCSRWMDAEGTPQTMEQEEREQWEQRNQEMAEAGLRVLGFATRYVDSAEIDPYEDLIFLGLFGFLDPPREDIPETLQACRAAGIRVVMVTGDQPLTARQVAKAIGLVEKEEEYSVLQGKDLKPLDELSEEERKHIEQASVLARVSPKQKLDLIEIHQRAGSVVAMTGDGVNDAPALKKADIGVAMGQRGTEVAKEAADMVLQDDAFPTVVAAVEQGRVIFANIRKFVLFLHSGNGCKILTVGLASVFNAPLPILPLQILFLNVITDVFPALALGVSPGTPDTMKHPPRDPKEPIVTSAHWWAIGGYGLLISIATLGALMLARLWLQMPHQQAITVSFLTLAFSQLWHVFNMRDTQSRIWHNEIVRNPYIWGSLVLCTLLLLAAVYLPPLAQALKVVHPGVQGWLLIFGMSLIPVTVGQTWKLIARHRRGETNNERRETC